MKTKLLVLVSLLIAASTFAAKPSLEEIETSIKSIHGKCSVALSTGYWNLIIHILEAIIVPRTTTNPSKTFIDSLEETAIAPYLRNGLPSDVQKILKAINELDETSKAKIKPAILELAEKYQDSDLKDADLIKALCKKF